MLFAALACAALIAGCDGSSTPTAAKPAVSQQDQNYESQLLSILRQRYPLPKLTDSSDLRNQIQYAAVQSDPNKLEYLAFVNLQGQVYFQTTIKGQVSAESTRITAPVKDHCYQTDSGDSSANGIACEQDPQPDLTGTFFSQSGGGYFAYLTDGALIQWPASVQFLTSDQPFKISAPPSLSINETAPITPTHPHIQTVKTGG